MGMKDERAKHSQDVRNRMYDRMDENCGFKEPPKAVIKKQEEKEKAKLAPLQCEGCKLLMYKCYVKMRRQYGEHFKCDRKQV